MPKPTCHHPPHLGRNPLPAQAKDPQPQMAHVRDQRQVARAQAQAEAPGARVRHVHAQRETHVQGGGSLQPAVAVEQVFLAVNTKTALKLAHVRGVALLAAAEAGLEVGEYSPLEIKSSVVGYGRAEKSQVQKMVGSLLRLERPLASEDASDALAAAICHATKQSVLKRIEVSL